MVGPYSLVAENAHGGTSSTGIGTEKRPTSSGRIRLTPLPSSTRNTRARGFHTSAGWSMFSRLIPPQRKRPWRSHLLYLLFCRCDFGNCCCCRCYCCSCMVAFFLLLLLIHAAEHPPRKSTVHNGGTRSHFLLSIVLLLLLPTIERKYVRTKCRIVPHFVSVLGMLPNTPQKRK